MIILRKKIVEAVVVLMVEVVVLVVVDSVELFISKVLGEVDLDIVIVSVTAVAVDEICIVVLDSEEGVVTK